MNVLDKSKTMKNKRTDKKSDTRSFDSDKIEKEIRDLIPGKERILFLQTIMNSNFEVNLKDDLKKLKHLKHDSNKYYLINSFVRPSQRFIYSNYDDDIENLCLMVPDRPLEHEDLIKSSLAAFQ